MISPPLTDLAKSLGDNPEQPKVTGTPDVRGFNHDGMFLDLYLDSDEDGYYVTDIALTGSNVSLISLFDESTLDKISAWCCRNLESQACLARAEHAADVYESWVAAGRPGPLKRY